VLRATHRSGLPVPEPVSVEPDPSVLGQSFLLMRRVEGTDDDGGEPRAVRLELDDSGGRTHLIQGEITSCLPWHIWPNVLSYFCQTRWTWSDRVGYGDVQDMNFGDHVLQFARVGGCG